MSYAYATVVGAKRLTGVTGADGETTTYGYSSPTGGLSKITDPLGHVSARNTYDRATGRITRQRDETGAETTFAWDEATQTATITDPTGRVRQDVYNGLNLVRQVDGDGAVTEILYDADNNPSGLVDAGDQLYREDYDDRDRLVRRVAPSPLFYAETWTYDDADHVTSHTDADGFTTSYVYNEAGLVTSQASPDGGATTYTYTTGQDGVPANLLASQTDPLGRTTTYTYNAVGDVVAVTSPGGHTSAYAYDDAHRLISATTPTGAVTAYTYDVGGRLLTTTDPLGGVTSNTYDAAGRLTRTTDPAGSWVAYTYDRADRVTRVRQSGGRVTWTAYDDAGRVATTTNPLGGVTAYTYDNVGRLLTSTDPTGGVSTNAYDDLGRLTSTTDPTGGVTAYTYDVVGQVTTVTDPDGVTQTMTYDRRGNVTSTLNADGGGQTVYYDAMGRVSATWDSDGVHVDNAYDLAGQLVEVATDRSTTTPVSGYYSDRTTFTYDADGNRVGAVDPRGHVPGAQASDYTTTVTYDGDGRPVTGTDALGRVTTTAYDLAGRRVSVTDPAGNVTATTYDADGRITQVLSPAGNATRYTYNRAGNLTRVRDPRGRVTRYTYDAAGNVLTRTDPLGRVTAMTYNVAGELTTTVKPSGTATTEDPTDATIAFAYDPAHRVTGVSYSDDTPATTYTYSPAGRLTAVTRAGEGLDEAGTAYTYDSLGRPVTVTRTGPTDSVANYAYTTAGRLAGVSWSTGLQVAYDYNSVGQFTAATPGGTGGIPAVALGYDPAGELTTVTRGGLPATVTAYAYDRAGQLAGLTHQAGTTVLADYQVVRDERGYPVQATTTTPDPVTGVATSSTTLSEFDVSGWLTSQCTPVSGSECTSTSPETTYTYDRAGVRTRVDVRRPTATGARTTRTRYTVDAADQLLTQSTGGVVTSENTWTVDGAIASTTTVEGTRTYDTDLAGEVTGVGLADGSQVAYAYDPQGNRTARTIDADLDATWVWDESTGLSVRVGEYSGTGTLDTAWLPDPTSATGAAWAAATTTGAAVWLLGDPYANTTTAVGTTGTTTASGTRVLDAFGNPTASTGDVGALGFAGQYLDQTTGLYDMRARDYDPATGQFTTTDPVTTPIGMAYVSGFTYGLNNPLMYTDPTGMWSCASGDTACDIAQMLAGEAWGVGEWGVDVLNSQTPWGRYQTFMNLRDRQQALQDTYGMADWAYYAEGIDAGNPFAGTRDTLHASWSQADQGNYLDAGRDLSPALADVTLTLAPFAKTPPTGSIARTPCAVDTNTAPRFVASADGIIDTQSLALARQVDDVVTSLRTSGQPPAGVYQGGYKGQTGVYANLGGDLPLQPVGYYTESGVWPGSPGTERIVIGQQPGEVWYSPDHYGTFRSWP